MQCNGLTIVNSVAFEPLSGCRAQASRKEQRNRLRKGLVVLTDSFVYTRHRIVNLLLLGT